MKRWDKLESEGWEFVGYYYIDGSKWLQSDGQKLIDEGYETKTLRERTDTKGLKMVSLWKREEA